MLGGGCVRVDELYGPLDHDFGDDVDCHSAGILRDVRAVESSFERGSHSR
jgi:hypothetical protein